MTRRQPAVVKGRYRWRTRVRVALPFWATGLFPRGAKDCREHEWFRADADTFHCYHCEAGVLKAPDLP
ncbi:hypothetical protein F4553_001339 [Allocatelliglobosispora scoriae]|uniref:Uncharacterized protein n=1 Tax=Allocatelliglobosispora scoriae TaxID=643052 RepID=A0A841BMB1_9ACTN|nr:hypothetical protein [Allocatelliglobosispora scoriae]